MQTLRAMPSVMRMAMLLALLGAAFSGAEATTAQTLNVAIYQAHLFLWPMGEQLWVVEHYLIGNAGAEPYLAAPNSAEAEDSAGLRFPLPAGAARISAGTEDAPGVSVDDRYLVTENAVIFTQPIPPGDMPLEVRFSYLLPLRAGQPITRAFPLPVESAVLLLVGEGWQLAGTGLAGFGTMEVSGQSARGYSAEPLRAGAPLSFVLEAIPAVGAPVTSPPSANSVADSGLLIGLALLILACGLAYWLWRPATSPLPPMPESVRATVAEIAALDARYRRGELERAPYQEARQALLARIRAQLAESSSRDRSSGA